MRHRSWELACSLLAIPAIVCAVWNPELVRMALGAFGSEPGVVLRRWLLVALLFTLVALWRRRAVRTSGRSQWLSALVVLAMAAMGVTLMRDRGLRTRNVTFRGNDITLAGTMFVPDAKGPFPAVVLVHGSPPLKRGFYAVWAERLAREGFVVLVADKRGVGGTGGTFNNQNNGSRANLTLLAGDVTAAVEYLAQQAEVDSARVGLIGVSQAGWVAPLAASMSPRIRYIALVTAPAVSVFEEQVWSELRGDDQRSTTTSRAAAEKIMDTVNSRGFNPRPLLGALNIPGVWMFGDDDNSIPTQKSVAVLDSLRLHADKDYASYRFPRAGHALITRSAGVMPRIQPTSWEPLIAWLQVHGKSPRGANTAKRL